MTSLTDTQVVTASGGLVELGYSQITSSVTVGTSVTNVSSVLTVVCDGSPILVEFFAPSGRCWLGGDNLTFSLFEDGTQKASPWGESVAQSDLTAAPIHLQYRLTPSAGSHTYQVKAVSSLSSSQQIRAGSGGTGSPAYAPAFLRVSKIVQATQWPAVTTGTIICTSSTRPASPFEGQTIYETDTGLTRYYDGSSWEDTARATRPYHAEVYLASNISYPRATNLQWTHLREDNTGGAWAASPNPERLVFPADGMYLCVANMRWDVGTGNDSTQTSMNVNGGGLGSVLNVGYAVNSVSVYEILTSVAVVSAGNYLTVNAFNKPAGGSPFTASAGSWMSFTQLSAVPT
ncbi:MAG: hypothetical protein ACO3HV_10090 [Candidatus Nanopelagicales bacterium]